MVAALLAISPFGLCGVRAEEVKAEPAAPAAGKEQAAEDSALHGALAFTADGSFSSVWKLASKDAAEAKVKSECAAFARGNCEIIPLPGELCAAIATFHRGKIKATFSGAALSPEDARRIAMQRCAGDARSGGKCQLRTAVCGDGR
jgi:hypothetical protein